MPRSRKRKRVREREARDVQQVQRRAAERRRLSPQQYARRRTLGWSLVVLATTVGVTHWLAHLGLLYEDRALWDLTIGYPTAAVLGLAAVMVLSKA